MKDVSHVPHLMIAVVPRGVKPPLHRAVFGYEIRRGVQIGFSRIDEDFLSDQ
jgi:hypothetical protein